MARLTRALAAIGFALALGALPDVRVAACDCALQAPEEAVIGADAAFVGTVVRFEEVGQGVAGQQPIFYHFAVDGVAKGRVYDVTSLIAGRDSAACGTSFVIGERWLVFGTYDGAFLSTHLCSGNVALAAGAEAPLPLAPPLLTAPSESTAGGLPMPAILVGASLMLICLISLLAFRRAAR